MEGFVKAIRLDKGFGFVTADDGEELFFHANYLRGLEFDEQLLERRVQFVRNVSNRGPQATHVRALQ